MTRSDHSAGPAFRQAFTRALPRNSTTHWLDIAAMLAEVAFETDVQGRFTAFGQSTVLGTATTRLIGRNISELCRLAGNSAAAGNSFSTIFATLNRQNLAWRGVVTLPRADGGESNYQIFLAPKPAHETTGMRQAGTDSPMAGAYGLMIDLSAAELQIPTEAGRAIGMLDPQTGLWSATAFAEETGRRFDRLDVEGLPGTLLLLGFSRTPAIGHKAVATGLADELRDIIRPTDILGRINATTFGLWCDSMDDLTGAERASRFCQRLPAALPGNPCICVGLVARWPGNMEEPLGLIKQAARALQRAERVARAAAEAGSTEPVAKGTWRVWNAQLG